jgi:hypothetical protein
LVWPNCPVGAGAAAEFDPNWNDGWDAGGAAAGVWLEDPKPKEGAEVVGAGVPPKLGGAGALKLCESCTPKPAGAGALKRCESCAPKPAGAGALKLGTLGPPPKPPGAVTAGAWCEPNVNAAPLDEPPSFTGGAGADPKPPAGAGAEPKLPAGAGAASGAAGAVFPK